MWILDVRPELNWASKELAEGSFKMLIYLNFSIIYIIDSKADVLVSRSIAMLATRDKSIELKWCLITRNKRVN
jgi:hypothetical protein